MPIVGFQMRASNPTWHIANGLSAWSRATRSRKCTSEWARTTPFSAGSYLHGGTRRKETSMGGEENAHLMIMVSSISSTPYRSRFAKTGGTARTMDALTERNPSFPFSLRAFFFGELSTSMGSGGLLRFIFLACVDRRQRHVPLGCTGTDRSEIPAQLRHMPPP